MIKINDKGFQSEIEKLKARLSRQEIAKATSRAMNRAIHMAKTEAKRQIRIRYAIKAGRLNTHLRTAKSSKTSLLASLAARTALTPLHELGNPRQNLKGAAATVIKGQRKTINHTFIAKLKSGHKGIFAKSNAGDKSKARFDFRKKRIETKGADTPIQELKTVSVSQATLNDVVMKVLEAKTKQDYEKRVLHELKRMMTQ